MANGDLRQMVNSLQLWRMGSKVLGSADLKKFVFFFSFSSLCFADKSQHRIESKSQVDVSLFEIVPRLVSETGYRETSFSDKLDLYFTDYSFVPLMVQENYLNASPTVRFSMNPSLTASSCFADAAESISDGRLYLLSRRNWRKERRVLFFSSSTQVICSRQESEIISSGACCQNTDAFLRSSPVFTSRETLEG